MNNEVSITKETQLFSEIKSIIDSAKKDLAVQVNSTMSALYWEIGNRINQDLLKEKRAEYGKQIVPQLAKQLQTEYGSNSFSEKNLRRMMQFASVFPDRKIVVSLIRQFSWTHIIAFIPIQDELKRSFYMEMCRLENWSVRTLREKIDGMLYERTAISKKSEETIKNELAGLKNLTNSLQIWSLRILIFLIFLDFTIHIPRKIWRMQFSQRWKSSSAKWEPILVLWPVKSV